VLGTFGALISGAARGGIALAVPALLSSADEPYVPPPMVAPQSAPIDESEKNLFVGSPALIPDLATLALVVLTLGLWLIVAYLKSIAVNYRITNKRIVVESGVLGKRMDQIDLYRVNDYTVDRPFSQRLLGTGNLLLKTMDRTTPELTIKHIKTDVVALYELLRSATELDKAQRSVRVVDYE
jgi:uncharacterized membrane protein YdbT with pleckstrin-like domain